VNLDEFLTALRDRLSAAMAGFVVAFGFCFALAEQVVRLVPRSVADRLLQDPLRPFLDNPIAQDSVRVRVAIFGAICLSFLLLAMQEWTFWKTQKRTVTHD
jgi:sec-independent protein translocase protein TatC